MDASTITTIATAVPTAIGSICFTVRSVVKERRLRARDQQDYLIRLRALETTNDARAVLDGIPEVRRAEQIILLRRGSPT